MTRLASFLVPLAVLSACGGDDSSSSPTGAGTDGGANTTDAGDSVDGNTGEVKPPRRVFVTQARRTGANGGRAGADAVCAEEAKGANITGTFVAWLSTPGKPAAAGLPTDVAYARTDGRILWQSGAELAAGKDPLTGIKLDASGKELASPPEYVWTGTLTDGKPAEEHCLEWTTNVSTAKGRVGQFGGLGKNWTDAATSQDCGQSFPLICFEK